MVKNNIIFISGPASSGKSTLAKYIEKEFNYYRIDEVVRNIPNFDIKKMFKDEEYAKVMQQEALLKYYNSLMDSIRTYKRIVVDRYFYDFYVYAKMYIKDEIWLKHYWKTIELFEDGIDFHSNVLVVKTYPLDIFENDGFRYTENYDKECKLFNEVYKNKPVVRLKEKDLDKRKKIINNYIFKL